MGDEEQNAAENSDSGYDSGYDLDESTDFLDPLSQKTRVIGIVSGKGGVGKTTFAANLSIALNSLGFKVVVVDCNVTTPHLSYYLGVKNFSSTLNNVFSGDLDVMLAPLDQNGVMFIPASERFVDLKKVDMKDLKKITARLAEKGDFDFVILDSAPGLGREAVGVMQACNEIIFLTNPTPPNVMDLVRCNEVAHMLGHKKFSMVMNMVRGKDFELTPARAEELFGFPVLGVVPFDENVMDSTAEGVPILWYRPKSKSCNSFLSIAARVVGVDIDKLEREEEGERVGPFGITGGEAETEAEEGIEEEAALEEGEKAWDEEEMVEEAEEAYGGRRRILPIVRKLRKARRRNAREKISRKLSGRKIKVKVNIGQAVGKVAKRLRRIFRK